MSGSIVHRPRRHDPEWNALRQAIKVAVAVTTGLAIDTTVLGAHYVSEILHDGKRLRISPVQIL